MNIIKKYFQGNNKININTQCLNKQQIIYIIFKIDYGKLILGLNICASFNFSIFTKLEYNEEEIFINNYKNKIIINFFLIIE